jgi:L-malate glycosyltransferase
MCKEGENAIRIMVIASGDLWAGAEAIIYELCNGLNSIESVEVKAIFLNENVVSKKCREAKICTHIIDENTHNMPELALRLGKIVRRFQPHVIHSHRYKENLIAACMKLFWYPVQLVSTVHGRYEHQNGVKTEAIRTLNSFVMRHLFSAVVAVSQDMKSYLQNDLRTPENRIHCIVNGIGKICSDERKLMERDFVTIGSAGRLVPVKNYQLLIDVAKELCNRAEKVKFRLAGNGPEMESLQKLIIQNKLSEKFELIGHVQNMEEFYRTLDIYINTSMHEGMPVTLLEAMSHGLAVVVPEIGGFKELLLNDVDGILVKSRNVECFANAITRLIRNKKKTRLMGIMAKRKIELKYSSIGMVWNYCNLYRAIL